MQQPRQQYLSELGCLLGAFRDVAHSIGMEVMAVTLVPVPPGSEHPEKMRRKPLPKDQGRHILKLLSLIQTFVDSIFHVGYVLSDIDFRHVEPPSSPNARKPWTMRVVIGDAPPPVAAAQPQLQQQHQHQHQLQLRQQHQQQQHHQQQLNQQQLARARMSL